MSRLKVEIRKRNLKQFELAKELKISESHVSLLVQGKRRMNIDQAHQFATAMDVTIDDIYTYLKKEDR